MQSFLPKLSKHYFAILFLSLSSSISFTQFIENVGDCLNVGLSANQGTYSYRATVKARANNPGKNEVEIQVSIVTYEITDFLFNGEHSTTLQLRSGQAFESTQSC
ncbi:hypothetical protein KFZ70_02800 [Tamlana fucoidanivorans]|uniref:Uncharacterized protein n=1 Tax=Allotamlana fucoidanivorans TaxID=2583814 RepID=A0A5C4SF48_9FLAO|nr:hypothetical protein [Tamlana fucoidanivorans]TNJ41909.1 hypothetical protein FGF67_15230 [Tamlana fucoidanivorans]